jgi:hypothetical protein
MEKVLPRTFAYFLPFSLLPYDDSIFHPKRPPTTFTHKALKECIQFKILNYYHKRLLDVL